MIRSKWMQTLKDYSPLLVGVPGIMLIHWCWFRLQENDLFVPPEHRHRNPSYDKMKAMFIDLKNRYVFPPKKESEAE